MRVHLLLAGDACTFMSNMTDNAVVLYARLKYILVSRLYVMCLTHTSKVSLSIVKMLT